MTDRTQRKIGRLLLCSCFLLACASLATAGDLWIHVYVQEDGDRGETVRVNVPFSLVQKVLPLIRNEHLRDGKVLLPDEIDLEGIDLREIWQAVRETADGEFVRVEGSDENVLVAKRDGMLIVNVDDGDDKVRVRLPLEVIDAMFSGDSLDEIDVLAALRVLGESFPSEEIVTVDDGSTKVRVWIDDRQEMDL
jgi:hypothetical protein